MRVERTAAHALSITVAELARPALLMTAAIVALFIWIPGLRPSSLGHSRVLAQGRLPSDCGVMISGTQPPAFPSKPVETVEAERQAGDQPTVITFSLCSAASWPSGVAGDGLQWTDPLVTSADFAGRANSVFHNPADVTPVERPAVRAAHASPRRRDAKPRRKSPSEIRAASQADPDGIVLTSTILGSAHRAAIINGRLYREGDKLLVGRTVFRVVKVGENQIELAHDGKTHGRTHHRVIHVVPPAQQDGWLTKQPQMLRGPSEAG